MNRVSSVAACVLLAVGLGQAAFADEALRPDAPSIGASPSERVETAANSAAVSVRAACNRPAASSADNSDRLSAFEIYSDD